MPNLRSARAGAIRALALAALLAGCDSGDSTTSGLAPDVTPPKVTLARAATSADTMVSVAVNASDDLGILRVSIRSASTALGSASFDTTFTSAVTSYAATLNLPVARTVPPGTTVRVFATVTDGAGHSTTSDTISLSVGNLAPPSVRVTSPATGSIAVSGKSLLLGIAASAPLRIRAIGYTVTGAFTKADSTVFGSGLRDTLSVTDTLAVPAGTAGNATVTPFVIDSLGQRVTGTGITLSVQATGSTSTVPVVTFGVNPRLEVTDTVHVEATDPSGITALGYEVRDAATGTLIAADSAVYTADLTSRFKTFTLRLPISTFPTRVTVRAFARNGGGTRAYSGASTAAPAAVRADTALVVAGVTRGLPNGGVVADAYYHARFDRLFLTNIERNQLEVFSLADSSFKAPVGVGSRPWGLVPWPRNRNGDAGDTLLVANSGGTNISYVNLNAGTSGREVYRYPLPNILVYSVKTEKSSSTGALFKQRTLYDFSDRPQFLAATCNGSTAIGAPCGDVVLAYSTTPTGGQTSPFPNQGTLRWENLTRRTSHFFFEQAIGQTAGSSDTLEIERYAAADERGNFVGSDSVLVPFIQNAVGPSGDLVPYSVTVKVPSLAFRDTTFVRNSGNFRRAVFGEGGAVVGSRGLTYDATAGLQTSPDPLRYGSYVLPQPVIDRGVSRPVDVTDFIANTFERIAGVAMNFDGELSAFRGDSTYITSASLRLQGLLQTSAGNAGFDFHPRNTGQNSLPLTTRLAFAASSEPQIEVYDSYCYQRVAVLPVRDPIIGPIKSALRSNGQIVLIGATARGVVIVTLPSNLSTSCS